jgi:hypothetical protein
MPLTNQNTKERAQRIRLDYLRRRGWLDRWKLSLVFLAIAAAAAYAVWTAVGNDTLRQFSPGPLAQVHAMWDRQCEVCHTSFVPTGSTAWSADRHASDKLCEACHKVPDHVSNQIHAEIEGCAACHSDHHGRNANLTNVADSTCTVCHANIAAHVYGGEKAAAPRIKDVTDFVMNHPEFKLDSPRKDPGPLKFSHLWHLLPGLPFGKGPYRLSDLSPQDRERYRKTGQTNNDLITLDCSACHELNRTEGSPRGAVNGTDIGQAISSSPLHAAGDYMLPISYEMHCRACHPLSYSGSTQPAVAAATSSESERLAAKAGETVPHGWSDPQLRQYLERVLSGQLLNNADANTLAKPLPYAVKNQPAPNSPLPNRAAQPHPQAKTMGDYLKAELNDRVEVLRNECLVCHVAKNGEGLEVLPVSVTSRWLEQAKFNHSAHRMKDCETCHTFDFPKQLPTDPAVICASDFAEKLIPKRQVCLECHSPPRGSGADAKGGARFDCIECHRYHGAEVHVAGATATDKLKTTLSNVGSSVPGTGEGANK